MDFWFCLTILVVLVSPLRSQYDDADNPTTDSDNKPKEINVIIFFVSTNISDQNDHQCGIQDQGNANGPKLLNFTRATEILPCTSKKEAEVTGSVNRLLRYSQNSCDCKSLLKASLMSLIGYARNAMGLTTAISSITETEIRPKDEFLPEMEENLPQNFFQTAQGFPEKQSGSFRSPSQKKINPFRKASKMKRDSLFMPDTVDVFNITSGVKEKREQNREIADIPALQEKPKTVWDSLRLMKTIRQSFFDSFFNPIFDQEKRMTDEENGLNLDLLGRIQEPSLFELVRRTLRQLQMQKTDNGFLVAFFGGHICDIRDPRSDLMQSVKHILENSDEEDTLAVLTGSCPKDGRIGSDEGTRIPLYVRGPRSNVFYDAKELYDVPKLAQVAMMQHRENKKRYNKVSKENY